MKNKKILLLIILLNTGQIFAQKQMPPSNPQPSQETYRSMVTTSNMKQIQQNNANSPSASFGPNKFTHLTQSQFAATYLGALTYQKIAKVQPPSSSGTSGSDGPSSSSAPLITPGAPPPTLLSVNWTGKYVTTIKNQGSCGSCWAFAAIGEIQSFYLYKHSIYLDLSQQQMVDCVPTLQYGNLGCGGGYSDGVGLYAIRYPLTTEKLYPYTGYTGTCSAIKNATGSYKIKQLVFITDCNALVHQLIVRPVAVCGPIDSKWQSYISGVISDCSSYSIGGHCVMMTGVSSDATNSPSSNYWIIKNSWGTTYGELGYMRLYRDKSDVSTGFCGFCKTAMYSM